MAIAVNLNIRNVLQHPNNWTDFSHTQEEKGAVRSRPSDMLKIWSSLAWLNTMYWILILYYCMWHWVCHAIGFWNHAIVLLGRPHVARPGATAFVRLSVWHTCDLWPNLPTNLNNLGVLEKLNILVSEKSLVQIGGIQVPESRCSVHIRCIWKISVIVTPDDWNFYILPGSKKHQLRRVVMVLQSTVLQPEPLYWNFRNSLRL